VGGRWDRKGWSRWRSIGAEEKLVRKAVAERKKGLDVVEEERVVQYP
jgi:hypothetical protein